MSLFSMDEIATGRELCNVAKDTEVSGLEDMKDSRIEKRYREKHTQLISAIADAGMPVPGVQYRLVTRRTFNAAQFVAYVAEVEGIEHMRAAIYSINHEAAKILADLLDTDKIDSAELCISNLRNKAHRTKEQLTKDIFVNHPKVELWFCSSHAKIVAMKTRADNHYVIEGSGNMSYNSRVEQYVIDNDKEIYEWTGQWMQEMRSFLKGRKELVEFPSKKS